MSINDRLARAMIRAHRAFADTLEAELSGDGEGAPSRAERTPGAPLYATAENNPLGSARAFLDAHRRKDFATFKRGRTVSARWADVEAWMVGRPKKIAAVQEPANDQDEEEAFREACSPKPRRKAG